MCCCEMMKVCTILGYDKEPLRFSKDCEIWKRTLLHTCNQHSKTNVPKISQVPCVVYISNQLERSVDCTVMRSTVIFYLLLFAPNMVNMSGRKMCSEDSNAPSPMLVSDSGSVTEVNGLLPNAPSPMLVSDSGNVTEVN